MARVNLIGAGKVGRTLLSLLKESDGVEIGDVFSARRDSAEAAVAAAGSGHVASSLSGMRGADFWLLAVPDDKIAEVAENLSRTVTVMAPAAKSTSPVAVHFSGFLSSEVLAPLRKRGWAAASCHPVLSFADPDLAMKQFPGTFCGIEGDPRATRRVASLMADLGGRPFAVNSGQKALYHAAAVFSNNFTVVLQAIALEAWAEAGVDEPVAQNLCAALLRSTVDNVTRTGPPRALTGPAARGDEAVLRRQQELVANWHPDAGELYRLLSVLARRLKRHGSTLRLSDGDEQSPKRL